MAAGEPPRGGREREVVLADGADGAGLRHLHRGQSLDGRRRRRRHAAASDDDPGREQRGGRWHGHDGTATTTGTTTLPCFFLLAVGLAVGCDCDDEVTVVVAVVAVVRGRRGRGPVSRQQQHLLRRRRRRRVGHGCRRLSRFRSHTFLGAPAGRLVWHHLSVSCTCSRERLHGLCSRRHSRVVWPLREQPAPKVISKFPTQLN